MDVIEGFFSIIGALFLIVFVIIILAIIIVVQEDISYELRQPQMKQDFRGRPVDQLITWDQFRREWRDTKKTHDCYDVGRYTFTYGTKKLHKNSDHVGTTYGFASADDWYRYSQWYIHGNGHTMRW